MSVILGGGGNSGLIGAGGTPSSGMSTPVPGSPAASLQRGRVGAKGVLDELNGDVGLAGRWGLRGKKGKSIQV